MIGCGLYGRRRAAARDAQRRAGRCCRLPHPSGQSRWLNDPARVALLDKAILRLARTGRVGRIDTVRLRLSRGIADAIIGFPKFRCCEGRKVAPAGTAASWEHTADSRRDRVAGSAGRQERRGHSRAHLRADGEGEPRRTGRAGAAPSQAADLLRAEQPQLLLAPAHHQIRPRRGPGADRPVHALRLLPRAHGARRTWCARRSTT